MPITILAIESSCDDTACAIIQDAKILSNVVSSQIDHNQYGGVIPELASRQHLDNIEWVIEDAIDKASIDLKDLTAIAVTRGPGLLGSLLVGLSYAKGLAMSMGIPIIDVHHMRAHALAHFIDEPRPPFPFLCLTVSGGHTQIVKLDSHDQFELLGETIDDAAGEAYDKIARMLGLGYPGGPRIDQLAKDGKAVFSFPTSKVPDLQFSFSGLKTSVLYYIRDQKKLNPDFVKENLENLCASVQENINTYLIAKLKKAVDQTGIVHVGIAGGVSANSDLRSKLVSLGHSRNWVTYIPNIEFVTDNAAMIAIAGYHQYLQGHRGDLDMIPFTRGGL